MEDFTIRRRNRLRHHYTIVSNVMLFGYHELSDPAKVTYLAIDSFDWGDGTGKRKGYAYPSLGRIARGRGVDRRTIRRHLAELEKAKLITREERPGRPNVLVIEDPLEAETKKYLRTFDDPGEDEVVLPTPDKIVRPYKNEERQERQNLVNGEQAHSGRGRRRLGAVPKAKREYLANEMLTVLQDEKSLGYYRRIAETVEQHRIFEALSVVKQMSREGKIRKTRGALFVSFVRRSLGSEHKR